MTFFSSKCMFEFSPWFSLTASTGPHIYVSTTRNSFGWGALQAGRRSDRTQTAAMAGELSSPQPPTHPGDQRDAVNRSVRVSASRFTPRNHLDERLPGLGPANNANAVANTAPLKGFTPRNP
jgi:hypothetical protein